jgi:hypothetical protein
MRTSSWTNRLRMTRLSRFQPSNKGLAGLIGRQADYTCYLCKSFRGISSAVLPGWLYAPLAGRGAVVTFGAAAGRGSVRRYDEQGQLSTYA